MTLHLTILWLAAWLTPREQREEWCAEWEAELWYVRREHGPATAFCLGAFKDAFWLRRNSPPSSARRLIRLNSPFQCLVVLAGMAAISVLVSLRYRNEEPVVRSDPDARHLMLVSHARRPITTRATVRLAEFQSWTSGDRRLFTALAFYQLLHEPLQISRAIPRHATVPLSIVRSTGNLFQLLKVPVPGPDTGVRLLLSQAAWRKYFDSDPQIIGNAIDVEGQRAFVAGVIPESSWRLPGRVDAWLLEDRQGLSSLPPDSTGFVVGRTEKASLHHMSAPNPSGGYDWFDCVPVAERMKGTTSGFLIIVMMTCVLLPAFTPLSLGEYPLEPTMPSDLWRWIFLVVKFALVLVMVDCGAHFLAATGGPVHGLLLGCILAFRWVLVDQRHRCPVCLRLLSNPVQIGCSSQTFLEWYGTELMCTRGHGLLHIPEIPTSCYRTRWLHLDRSWSGLFS